MSVVRTGPPKATCTFIFFISVKHIQNPTVLTIFIPISYMHYTFSYALYMITGVQKLNEDLHNTPEKQAS